MMRSGAACGPLRRDNTAERRTFARKSGLDAKDRVSGNAGAVQTAWSCANDNPQKKVELAVVQDHAARLARDLEALKEKERGLVAVLLPDAERARLAQFARDIRDDTLPDWDADVPVTPCPDWYEAEGHENRSGKYHEGAVLEFNLQQGTYNRLILSVTLDEGGPPINFDVNGQLNGDETQQALAGLERAISL
jgi:hypothetical protein